MAKNVAFNVAAKYSIWEAHAMEYMARPVSPQIISEEFTDYETLLADLAEDPMPITLPCIPIIAPETPRTSAFKRSRGNPVPEDEATRDGPADPGASGSGTGGTAAGAGSKAPLAQGATPAASTLTRAEQIASFIANPMMPRPHQVKMDHITFLLALVLEGELQEAAIQLLMQARTPEQASVIWDSWKGYFHPPPGHPLEAKHAIREVVFAELLPAYKTKAAGAKAAKALLDIIGDAIHLEAFQQ